LGENSGGSKFHPPHDCAGANPFRHRKNMPGNPRRRDPGFRTRHTGWLVCGSPAGQRDLSATLGRNLFPPIFLFLQRIIYGENRRLLRFCFYLAPQCGTIAARVNPVDALILLNKNQET
jgi:hypothetical protein